MKKLILSIAGTLMLLNLQIQAQIVKPVTWNNEVIIEKNAPTTLKFVAKIKEPWHFYAQNQPEGPVSLTFEFDPSTHYRIEGNVNELSKGHVYFDPSFEINVKTFGKEAVFTQKITPLTDKAFTITGTVTYQCCDDKQCIAPITDNFSFSVPAGKRLIAQTEAASQTKTVNDNLKQNTDSVTNKDTTVTTTDIKETKATETIVKDNSIETEEEPETAWGFFWYALVMGLAGVITPCVYPMIPMTVSFFMRGEQNKAKGVVKGLTFGLSIIGIYTLIGVLVSLSILSSDIGGILSSHWIPNSLFFALFLVFAASFFGMFEMVLPASLVNKVDKQADRGGLTGIFFMALTLVIVSFSCTGPIVAQILVRATQDGLALKPIAGMFGYSIAFALPFTLFAIFPTVLKSLPKSGGWLNSVKVMLGFIVLAFSLTFIVNIDANYRLGILSRDMFLAIWIVLAVLSGLYLLGKIKFSHDSDLPFISVPRLILAIVLFSFAIYLFTGLINSPLKPLGWILPAKETTSPAALLNSQSNIYKANPLCNPPKYDELFDLPHGLLGYFDLEEGLACAKEKNKPVFLDIKGHGCKNCKLMESQVWTDPRVLEKLANDFIIVALYVDEKTKLPENEQYISKFDKSKINTLGAKNLDYEKTKFNSNTQPLYAILDHNGNPLNGKMGMDTNIDNFLAFLNEGVQKFKSME